MARQGRYSPPKEPIPASRIALLRKPLFREHAIYLCTKAPLRRGLFANVRRPAFRKGHVIVLCLAEAAGLAAAEKARLVISAIGTQPTMGKMRFMMGVSHTPRVVDKVFHFDEAQAAYRHMASGAHFGKIVIRVG